LKISLHPKFPITFALRSDEVDVSRELPDQPIIPVGSGLIVTGVVGSNKPDVSLAESSPERY
jgi:hypothetical protein